jgi:hypothetical protein
VKDAEDAALLAEDRVNESGRLRKESGDLGNKSEGLFKESRDLRKENGNPTRKGEDLRIVPEVFRKKEERAGRGLRRGNG